MELEWEVHNWELEWEGHNWTLDSEGHLSSLLLHSQTPSNVESQ